MIRLRDARSLSAYCRLLKKEVMHICEAVGHALLVNAFLDSKICTYVDQKNKFLTL